ncbi:MAG: alpha-galactosidase [Oscillospiraceae bacterium]|nr:alpha-galactosidase [Oscillospiraceae bacterium]
MPITFDSEKRIFKLDTATSSYIFEIYEENYIVHLYYGAKIPDCNVTQLKYRGSFPSFSPNNINVSDPMFSPDVTPLEYSGEGTGDFRSAAVAVRNADGNNSTDFRYKSHKIYGGKPAIEGLPALYVENDADAQTLELLAEDSVTGVQAVLYYTVFENLGAMTRSVKIINASDRPVEIEKVYSSCVEFHTHDYELLTLYGKWGKERSLERRALAHGRQLVSSKRGSSSHHHNPFAAIVDKGATEDYGSAYGFNLVYSGNFAFEAEVNQFAGTRVLMGINPDGFGWKLEPGSSFSSPEVVMVYSANGIGEMSRIFHRLYRKHLIRGKWKDIKRPLLINNWEATGMEFTGEQLVTFAERAAELGIDMLVMDDGWFGNRDSDRCALGDWTVNEQKLGGTLSEFIEKINALGLKFGIWYEPEMISRDSELYRAHPDWCIHVPGREKSIARYQYVLDYSRQDVRDYIFGEMYKVLSANKIDYLKWDFNRNLTEVGSAQLPPERQKEVFHRFVLGTYEVMDRLTKAFPDMLIENCSGGGGRFDPGMLYYSPQIWTSDNTDPIERLSIQFGTSMCYPASTMGAHVSASRRTGYETKGNVALWGSFGYELDPNKFTEEDKKIVKQQVGEYHKYYDVIHFGDLYRLISPSENPFRAAWEFVSEDKTEALLTSVVMRKPEDRALFIKLKGLDPDKYYIDEDTHEVYSGALLMNAGLCIIASTDDGTSFKKYFKAVE